MSTPEEKIAQVTAKRQSEFKKLEDKVNGLSSSDPDIKAILDLKFMDLREKLQKSQLKPTEVLKAYQVKALELNKAINCITEPLPEAETVAEALDKVTDNKGLLYGIPISIKENIELKGYVVTTGLTCRLGEIAAADAKIVQILKEEGAIPFVRTNVPQTMMALESSNPIYGTTSNPHDHSRSPGGSTGGEGAIVGGGGSILGLGNDLGGSGRIPAAFCGTCSFKPTSGRLSGHGSWAVFIGQNIVPGAYGPFTYDVDSLVMFMKACIAEKHFSKDPYIVPMPFRNEMYEKRKPLRIGYSYNDGYMSIAESCVRAVSIAKEAMESAGHELVPFAPPKIGYSVALWCDACFGDNCDCIVKCLEGDIVDPCMQKALQFMKDYRSDKEGCLKASGITLDEGLRYCAQYTNITEWWKLNVEVMKYRALFLAAWKKANIDVLIYPSYACPAFPKGMVYELIHGISYTAIWNTVDYPAGVMPITTVTADDVKKTMEMEEKGIFEKNLKKATVGSEGLPVCIQCVGLPHFDELVLQIMKEIEEKVQYKRPL